MYQYKAKITRIIDGDTVDCDMELYCVKGLIPTDPPDGGEGLWWKYEIACGGIANQGISGMRKGALDEVEEYLKKMLDAINKRTLGYQSERLRHSHSSPRHLPVRTVLSKNQRMF